MLDTFIKCSWGTRYHSGRSHIIHSCSASRLCNISKRYRWMCDLPLRDGADALRVNWLSIEIADANGKVTLSQQLRHRSARRLRQRRRDGRQAAARAGRWRTNVQHAQNQGLQSRAQFRPRNQPLGRGPRHSQISWHSPAAPSPASQIRRGREPEPKSTPDSSVTCEPLPPTSSSPLATAHGHPGLRQTAGQTP